MDSGQHRGTDKLRQIASLLSTLRDQNTEARTIIRDYVEARTKNRRVDGAVLSAFLDRYEETVHKLLSLAPHDPDALAALNSAATFRALLQLY